MAMAMAAIATMRDRAASSLSGLLCGLLAVAAIAAPLPTRADVPVVVTIKPVHALAAGVMAGAGMPALLIDGAGSPHTYALKPSDARRLAEARIVFRVSEGLETFLDKVVRSLPKTVAIVTLDKSPGVQLWALRTGGTFEAHDHAKGHVGHGHTGHGPERGKGGSDAHIWLDPANARMIVRHMAEVLAEADPAKRDVYRLNAIRMERELEALGIEIGREIAPLAGKPYVVFHDAYQYFERRYGLAAVGAVTVSPEQAPSAKRLTELRRRVTALKATCVFAEPQFPPKLVATVIEGTGARAGTLDPLGAALPAGPDLYPTLLRNLAAGLKSCLTPPA